MKTAVLLLALCATAMAATTIFPTSTPTPFPSDTTTTDSPHTPGGLLDHWIKREVIKLVHENPTITVEQCSARCDAIFNLVSTENEQNTDSLCLFECKRVIRIYNHHHASTTTTTTSA